MCSPACMNRLFINLKILSKLQTGQKIYTSDNCLVLDDGMSVKQTLTRWWLNESREKTLEKIQEIIRSAIYFGQNAISAESIEGGGICDDDIPDCNLSSRDKHCLKQWNSDRDKYLKMDNIVLLKTLSKEMNQALVGMKNLKETYKDDATLNAKIDIEIELVGRYVERFAIEADRY
jgi:hypothetical protein